MGKSAEPGGIHALGERGYGDKLIANQSFSQPCRHLTIRNQRGHKATYSCQINMRYVALGIMDNECHVTFEAENNLDFRRGAGRLRNRGLAQEGDLAAISRSGENEYELRLYRQNSPAWTALMPYAVNLIGHQGEKYGYLPNAEFERIINVRVGM